MGMVIVLLKGCCLKISNKLFLKTKPVYIFGRDQMDEGLLRCMEPGCSLLLAQPSCTKRTHKFLSPSYRVILEQVIFDLTFNNSTEFYGNQRFIVGSTRTASLLSSEPNKSYPHPHCLIL